jgi:hypothetical protein
LKVIPTEAIPAGRESEVEESTELIKISSHQTGYCGFFSLALKYKKKKETFSYTPIYLKGIPVGKNRDY